MYFAYCTVRGTSYCEWILIISSKHDVKTGLLRWTWGEHGAKLSCHTVTYKVK